MATMNYEESVHYMSNLLQFGIRLDRERFVALLNRVGDPHKKLRCIHIAGTNGKGSTTTFVSSILRAARYKTASYLSPYVFNLRERVQINGEMIPEEDFARWVTILQPHMEALAETDLGPTTEFELKTAVAFCWFAEQEVDFAVIEVGLGGQLDATNVIPPPLVSIITSIGLDHVNILGDTLGKIASEKAGIIKKGTLACITAVPPGEALDAIIAKAEAEEVPLLRVSSADEPEREEEPSSFAYYRYEPQSRTISIAIERGDLMAEDLQHLYLKLRGPFQAANAACAAAAVTLLQESGWVGEDPACIRPGLERANLPGRFQIAHPGDEKHAALILDGAHNEDGARVLAEALRAEYGDTRRYRFVVGMRKNHEPLPHLEQIAALAKSVTATAPPFKPAPPEEVAAAARSLDIPEVTLIENTADAIRHTWERATPDEVVVVTGSFYVVGETPEDLRQQ